MMEMMVNESQSIDDLATPKSVNMCINTRCNYTQKDKVNCPGGSHEIGPVLSQASKCETSNDCFSCFSMNC